MILFLCIVHFILKHFINWLQISKSIINSLSYLKWFCCFREQSLVATWPNFLFHLSLFNILKRFLKPELFMILWLFFWGLHFLSRVFYMSFAFSKIIVANRRNLWLFAFSKSLYFAFECWVTTFNFHYPLRV